MAETQAIKHNILWVDDAPENNVREVRALEAFGIAVTQVKSTRQALIQLQARTFAAVVSDMGRWEGPREGYVLLAAMREKKNNTPFFFYAGSSDSEHVRETLERGGNGCTNEMQHLLQMVRAVCVNAA